MRNNLKGKVQLKHDLKCTVWWKGIIPLLKGHTLTELPCATEWKQQFPAQSLNRFHLAQGRTTLCHLHDTNNSNYKSHLRASISVCFQCSSPRGVIIWLPAVLKRQWLKQFGVSLLWGFFSFSDKFMRIHKPALCCCVRCKHDSVGLRRILVYTDRNEGLHCYFGKASPAPAL